MLFNNFYIIIYYIFVPKDREVEYSEDIHRAMKKTDVEKKKVQKRVFDRLRRNYERFWD